MHTMPLFTERPMWSIVFWASYAALALMETWIWRRGPRAPKGEQTDRGSLGFLVVAVMAGAFAAWWVSYTMPATRIGFMPGAVFAAAIAIMWLGIALRLWAVLTLGPLFRTVVILQERHHLVTTGPYRVLRHPSYTGGLLMLAGIGLALGNWLSVLIMIVSVLLGYSWRIHVEEAALRARFGIAYDEFRQRTWALIPWIW